MPCALRDSLEVELLEHKFPVSQRDGAAHHIFKLSHIPRPLIGLEVFKDSRRDLQDIFLELQAVLVDKVEQQDGDVRFPFPQRRSLDVNHIQAVKKIFSEEALSD